MKKSKTNLSTTITEQTNAADQKKLLVIVGSCLGAALLLAVVVGVVVVYVYRRKANTLVEELWKMKETDEASKEDEPKTTQVCTTQIQHLDYIFLILRKLKSLIYPILSPNPFFLPVRHPADWFVLFPRSQDHLHPLSNCYTAMHELILFMSVQCTSLGYFYFNCFGCHIS